MRHTTSLGKEAEHRAAEAQLDVERAATATIYTFLCNPDVVMEHCTIEVSMANSKGF